MLVTLFFDTESHVALDGLELTVHEAGLDLAAILMSQPPECWNYRAVPPYLTSNIIFKGRYNGRSSTPSESLSAVSGYS